METAASPEHARAQAAVAGHAMVDPRAPRFGQTLTATLLAVAIVLRLPALVGVVTVVLTAAVLTRWRVDGWGLLWRHVATRFVAPPAEHEAAAPHRFAKLLGAAFTLVAAGLLLVGGAVTPVGYAVAGLVALLAGLAAGLDVCIGCRLYRQVAFVRRLGLV
jgi:hypothetical protein